MPMGGSYHKGMGAHANGGNRGKPYGMILLLAFGAALLGVMVVHKLRERRIYNLLVKEKDYELASLRLLLQKERDQTNEMKKKNEEMEAKLYSLRNEKMELDGRFSEVQSTLDSLKDEQSIMEIAFEEKQKEIRMLREKEANWGKENSEVISLSERLKEKEAEIEDLKQQRLAGNLMVNQSLAEQKKAEVNEYIGSDRGLHESRYRIINGDQTLRDEDSNKGLKFSTRDKDENVESRGTIDRREMRSGEMLQENLEDGGGRKTEGDSGERVRNESAGEEREKKLDAKEDSSTQPQKFENVIDGRLQDIDLKYGLQQRTADNSGAALSSGKVKRRHLRKGRAKRWRAMVKSQLLGDNGISESNEAVVSVRNGNFYKDEQEHSRDGIQGGGSSDVGDEVVADNSIKVIAKSQVPPEDAKETDGEVAKHRAEEVHVQSWRDNGKHIKKEDDSAEEKTVYPKRTQETDDGDDGGEDDDGGYDAKESDSGNEDEKE